MTTFTGKSRKRLRRRRKTRRSGREPFSSFLGDGRQTVVAEHLVMWGQLFSRRPFFSHRCCDNDARAAYPAHHRRSTVGTKSHLGGHLSPTLY